MEQTAIALLNARIVDVRGLSVSSPTAVLLEGGVISEVGGDALGDAGIQAIDLKGRFLCPGLIDCHVHVLGAHHDLKTLNWLPASYLAVYAGRELEAMLRRGFTTVRDAGGADFGLVQSLNEGLIEGPRLLISGRAISQTGGHGDLRPDVSLDGCSCGSLHRSLGVVADGVAEVRKAAREQIRLGANQIKCLASGGVSGGHESITGIQFSLEELQALVEEATHAETYVMAHAHAPAAIRQAINAGARTIEHGNLLDAPTAEMMKAKGVYLVPTLVAYEMAMRLRDAYPMTAEEERKLGVALAAGLDALELAHRAGVKVAFGTDLIGRGLQPYQSEEFAIRAKRVPIAKVLQSATLVAAEMLGLQDRIGEIKAGMDADLVVFHGNPLEDIEVLAHPERGVHCVIKGGRLMAAAVH
jgi:imidazolonepropionase-like amidohydrolase